MNFEVVRGSLSGSVVGNLLLVLGFSLLFGGRGEIDRQSSFIALGLVGLTTLVLLIPVDPRLGGDPERDALVTLSIPVAVFLLVTYVASPGTRSGGTPRCTWRATRRSRPGRCAWRSSSSRSPPSSPRSSRRSSSPRSTSSPTESGLSEFFLAAVVIAIVGNAAEHGGAVVVAARGKIKLAAEIALASSAQVAVFLIPAVCLLALLIEPLALSFRQVEIAALAVSVVITSLLLADGRSSRLKG